jgi:MATE family multidrug resistance protein
VNNIAFFTIGKYKETIRISLPLVLSMGATTVMEFTDRIFLGRYSLDALAASMPAGITSFLFASFFMGTAGYVNGDTYP